MSFLPLEIGLNSEYYNIPRPKEVASPIGTNIESIIGGIMIEPSGSVSRIAPASSSSNGLCLPLTVMRRV